MANRTASSRGFREVTLGRCYVQTPEDRFGDEATDLVRMRDREYYEGTDDGLSEEGLSATDGVPSDQITAENPWAHHEPPSLEERMPKMQHFRNNLTALSQKYNLYFAAYENRLFVYRPRTSPMQTLPREPDLILATRPDGIARHMGGSQDPEFFHQANSLAVGFLGRREVVVLAYDDGSLIAYYTQEIAHYVGRAGIVTRAPIPSPFFHENVGASAWGIAIHQESRLIAASSNRFEITVFAFGLTKQPNGHKRGVAWDIAAKSVAARKRNWRILLLPGQGAHNIPNISFWDDKDGLAEKVCGVDIRGNLWVLDIWKSGTVPLKIPHMEPSSTNLRNPGWGVAVIPHTSCVNATSPADGLGVAKAADIRTEQRAMLGGNSYKGLDTTASLRSVRDSPSASSEVPILEFALAALPPPTPGGGNINAATQNLLNAAMAATVQAMAAAQNGPGGGAPGDETGNDEQQESEGGDEDEEEDEDDYDDYDDDESLLDPAELEAFLPPVGQSIDPDWDFEEDSGDDGLTSISVEPPDHPILNGGGGAASFVLSQLPLISGQEPPIPPAPAPPGLVGASPLDAFVLRDDGGAGGVEGDTRASDRHKAPLEMLYMPDRGGIYIYPSQTSRRVRFLLRGREHNINGANEQQQSLQHKQNRRALDELSSRSCLLRTYLRDVELLGDWTGETGVVCRDPAGLPLGHSFPMMTIRRLNMVLHVPELSLVVIGAAVGRVVLVTPTRATREGDDLGPGQTEATRNGSTKKREPRTEHGFRVDWVLPRKSDERAGRKPAWPLYGVAIGPVQEGGAGAGLALRADGQGPGRRAAGLGPRRYRLMLHYRNHAILTYEVSRDEEGQLDVL